MFQETIAQINNGAAVSQLCHALEAVVAAVRETGKSGSLTTDTGYPILTGAPR